MPSHLDKIKDEEWGRSNERTTTTGKKRGKLGHGTVNTTSQGKSPVPGLGGQVGVYDGKLTEGVRGTLLSAKGNAGKFKDDDDAKGKRHGLQGEAAVLGGELKTKKLKDKIGSTTSADAQVLNTEGSATFNRKKGFNLGGTANIVAGSGTLGNRDKSHLRVGGALGAGAGIRGGWGKNQDGKRQLSAGFDIGPLSMDAGMVKKMPEWLKKSKKGLKKAGKQVGKGAKKINRAFSDN